MRVVPSPTGGAWRDPPRLIARQLDSGARYPPREEMDEYLAGYNDTHNDVYLQTLAAATVISLNSDELRRSHDEASRQQTYLQSTQPLTNAFRKDQAPSNAYF